jgi:hypothetical protein
MFADVPNETVSRNSAEEGKRGPFACKREFEVSAFFLSQRAAASSAAVA